MKKSDEEEMRDDGFVVTDDPREWHLFRVLPEAQVMGMRVEHLLPRARAELITVKVHEVIIGYMIDVNEDGPDGRWLGIVGGVEP